LKAVILAGGKGTRLGTLTETIPKPLISICGKPILVHQIDLLKRYGIVDIILLTGYKSEVIERYFEDNKESGVNISYFRENKPLGTTGGVKEIEDRLTEDFLLLYGDIMVNMNIEKLIHFHKKKNSDCTLVVHPNDHPYDSDLVELNEDLRITAFHSKPHEKGQYYRNLVNAAVYVMSPVILKYIQKGVNADFGKDLFPKIFSREKFFGYNTAEYMKDVGTVERLKEVTEDCISGKIERLNIEHKKNAIFLDRDGVINREVGLLYKPDQFVLLPQVGEAVRKINSSEFLSIVVTNQPVIARNLCSIHDLEYIHRKMETLLGEKRAKIDSVYYCPHHPDRGYPEENPKYKIDCECRKPKIGMIKRAVSEFNIDLTGSYIVGDTYRDIECGNNAGLSSIALRTGYGCKEKCEEADFFFQDLNEAVSFILDPPEDIYKKVSILYGDKKKRPFIIVVGGCPLSGKSILVNYLSKRFRECNTSVWTLDIESRLLSREIEEKKISKYNRAHLETANKEMADLLDYEEMKSNRDSLLLRKMYEGEEAIHRIDDVDIIIIEGRTALRNHRLREIADSKILCKTDCITFQKRFEQLYVWLGMDKKKSDTLTDKRRKEQWDEANKDIDITDIVWLN
jgi:histidinol-phosphate phosphatase family protein